MIRDTQRRELSDDYHQPKLVGWSVAVVDWKLECESWHYSLIRFAM